MLHKILKLFVRLSSCLSCPGSVHKAKKSGECLYVIFILENIVNELPILCYRRGLFTEL